MNTADRPVPGEETPSARKRLTPRDQRVPMLIAPTAELVAFVTYAVRELTKQYRRDGAPVPDGLAEFVAMMSFGVTQGQPVPARAGEVRTEQIEPMAPRVVTYATAAELLAISPRTLKRRIEAGDLHPISIGGTVRIRVAEINEYVAAAAAASTDKKGA